MEKIRDIFGYTNLVKVSDIPDFDEGMTVLEQFKCMGFKTPYLYGGAVRDHILGQPIRDLDVSVNIADILQAPSLENLDSWVKENLKYRNFERTIASESRDSFYVHYESKGTDIDTPLDISFESPQNSITKRALMASATIDSVAMDDTGQFYLHPLFMKHSENGIYVPLKRVSLRNLDSIETRFNKISQKYPNLSFSLPEEIDTNMLPPWKGKVWQKYIGLKAHVHDEIQQFILDGL